MATKKQVVIKEWQTVGGPENFTVLGLGSDNKVYYWKDKQWNEL
jgi:hypothetical protein